MNIQVYRSHPEYDAVPYMQTFSVHDDLRNRMVLDVLEYLHTLEPTLVYRRTCREGVCSSGGMNINEKNRLACITPANEAIENEELIIRPLPDMPVIRNLVVNRNLFFKKYQTVKARLINHYPAPSIEESLQSPEERARLDGLYECILCGCCSSQCPSWWWNPEKYLGPAALLQAWRFLTDSRDQDRAERLSRLNDRFSVFRCRSILGLP